MGDVPQIEKGSKNGQSSNMDVESSEKDRTVTSETDKTKESNENKAEKETANDEKLRTCILNVLFAETCLSMCHN